MRYEFLVAPALTAMLSAGPLAAQRRGTPEQPSWAAKPTALTKYTPPHKPHTKIADLKKKHAGHADWREAIVDDPLLHADYVSMAPGGKVSRRFHPDTRAWWIVTEGQIRFHIEGQEPFVASKGFLVQVPYRNVYWMETVGDEPSVRFEVTRTNRTPLYPAAQGASGAPTAKGKTYVLASYRTPPDPYTDKNKPYLDFWGDFVKRPAKRGDNAFVSDTTNFMNVIRGHGTPTPPDSNKGHFHIDYDEFWVVAEGTIDYKMEGMKVFTADVGDVVLAPQGRWHRASWAGDGMSTRIAINPRPEGMHNFDAESGARQ
jgi:mannose-6-phosphate isomerase-like protein (cupin superfamily)